MDEEEEQLIRMQQQKKLNEMKEKAMLNKNIAIMEYEYKIFTNPLENETKRQFNWKYITVTISILSFLSSLTYCMWACLCSRYKLKKKAANRYPRYMYWKAEEDKCEMDVARTLAQIDAPRTRAQDQQNPTPTQAVQPLQYPRHQLIIEDPRLALPDLQSMMRDAQQNQPQNPIDENSKTTYTDERKR